MDGTARRLAIRTFKEVKPAQGILAVRADAAERIWVGASRNLEATGKQFWFSLRLGTHPNHTLQKEWNALGEEAFRYEVLEKLDEDVSALEVSDLLKQKTTYWMERLNGIQI